MEHALAALKTWMVISAVIYGGGIFTFGLGQNLLLENINTISEKIFRDRFPLIPLSTEKFWLVLTNSMMVMLTVICIFVAISPEKYVMMTAIILFSKFASTSQYLALFFTSKKYLAYLVGALTDGPLFLITLYFFVRAV